MSSSWIVLVVPKSCDQCSWETEEEIGAMPPQARQHQELMATRKRMQSSPLGTLEEDGPVDTLIWISGPRTVRK